MSKNTLLTSIIFTQLMTINAKGEMNVKTGLSNNGSFVSPECRKTLSQLTTITPTQLMTINTKWGGGG